MKTSTSKTSPPEDLVKEDIKKLTKNNLREISKLQRKFSAQKKYGLLVVLQGMDASGKDGAIRKVCKAFNPSNCVVHGFKKPTDEEYHSDQYGHQHRIEEPEPHHAQPWVELLGEEGQKEPGSR